MNHSISRRGLLTGAASAALVAMIAVPSGPAWADAAVSRIQSYYSQLLPTIQQAGSLSVRERARRFRPAILGAFDIGSMVRIASGSSWSKFSGSQQSALRQAFAEFLVADYASQVDNYSGQSFHVDPAVESRGGRRIVKSQIIQSSGPVEVDYAMSGNRIIDVYFNGSVSDLATRRAEFESILSGGGGAAQLISSLRSKAASLLGR